MAGYRLGVPEPQSLAYLQADAQKAIIHSASIEAANGLLFFVHKKEQVTSDGVKKCKSAAILTKISPIEGKPAKVQQLLR